MKWTRWLKESFRWLAFAFALFSVQTAWATHGRSVDIQWTIPDASKPREVEFTITYVARRGFYGAGTPTPQNQSLAIKNSGGVTIQTVNVSLVPQGEGVDAMVGTAGYDGNYVLFRGRVKHAFTSNGTYTINFDHCCRASNLAQGNNDNNFFAKATVVLDGEQRSGPQAAAAPLFNFTAGALNVVQIPMFDPDGDAVTCRFATAAESGLTTLVPSLGGKNLTISNANNICTVTWDLRGISGTGFYALPLMLASTHNGQTSTAPVDRYMVLTSRSFPTCTGSGSAALQPNQNFSTTFEATGSTALSFTALSAPAGASFTPASGSTGASPMQVGFSWTPTAADAGKSFAFQTVFRDTSNVEGYCSYVINVDTRNATLALSSLADAPLSQPVLIQGTTSQVNAGEVVDLSVTTSASPPALTLSATVQADGSWQTTVPAASLPIGPVQVSATLRNFSVPAATSSFNVLMPSLLMNTVDDTVLGNTTTVQGTVNQPFNGQVEVTFLDALGSSHVVSAPVVAQAWQVSSPAALPVGTVQVSAVPQGVAGALAVTGQFQVLQPSLTISPITDVTFGDAPKLAGTSQHVPDLALEIVLLDSKGNTHTLSATLQAGVWSVNGPGNLPVGNVQVTVRAPGMPAVPAVSAQFAILTPAPVNVPANAGWALGLLGAAFAGAGLWRRRKAKAQVEG